MIVATSARNTEVFKRGNAKICKFAAFGLRSLGRINKDITMEIASCPAVANTVGVRL